MIPWKGVDEFLKWYEGIAQLKVSWAKPLIKLRASESKGGFVIRGERLYRRKPQPVTLFVCDCVPEPEGGRVNIYIGPRDLKCRRKSVIFFYSTDDGFLEPNLSVEVRQVEDLELVREVQMSSWGFYIPPPPGRVTLLALDERPVGCVYINPKNGNLDYGVHVIKERWRQRIGTRLLVESAKFLKERGLDLMSVVRVLGRWSDRRALSFYRANKPMVELTACELEAAKGL